jgi:hypothetical protein
MIIATNLSVEADRVQRNPTKGGAFSRPLDQAPRTNVWLDAMTEKVREDGCIQNVVVVIATASNAYRQGNRAESRAIFCSRPQSV